MHMIISHGNLAAEVKLSSKLSETLHCKLSLGATIMQEGCRGNIFKHSFLDALGRFEGFSALFIYHSWSYRSNSLIYHIWSCYIPQLLHCKCLFCILDLHGKV